MLTCTEADGCLALALACADADGMAMAMKGYGLAIGGERDDPWQFFA